MSSHFAEATVQIVPKLTGFVKDLEAQLLKKMETVKVPPVRVKPALSADFVGSLRTQINAAIVKAQAGIKPVVIKAVVSPVSKAGVATAAAGAPIVGAGGGATASAAAAERTLAGASGALARSQEAVALAQLRLNKAFIETIPLEEQAAAVAELTTALDKAQASAETALTKAIVTKDVALQRSARRQLTDVAAFRANVDPRVQQVQGEVAALEARDIAEKEATKVALAENAKREAAVLKAAKAQEAANAKATASAEKAAAAQAKAAEKAAAAQIAAADKAAAAQLAAAEKAIAAQTAALGKVDAANLRTQGRIAAISHAAVPGAKPVSARTAEFRAAQRADAAATVGLDTALATEAKLQNAAAGAATQNAIETKRLTVLEVEQRGAALGAAAAERDRAAAMVHSAKGQEELRRGGFATLLSRLGIRGATLAASGPFLAGAAAVTIFAKSIEEASREAEALQRVNKVLGSDLGEQLDKNARGLARSFGLSTVAALKFEGAIAEVFHNVGFADDQAAVLSERMVKLAADMASFNDVPVGDTLRALQLGISGNLRSLRQYGVIISNTAVNQTALAQSGKQSTKELDRQDLALARTTLILRDTANQTGAFADRSKDLAGQSRILQSELANLAGNIGTVVVPAVTALVTAVNDLFLAYEKLNHLKIKLPSLPKEPKGLKGFLDSSVTKITKHVLIDIFVPTGLITDIDRQIGGIFNRLQKLGNTHKINIAFPRGTDPEVKVKALSDAIEKLKKEGGTGSGVIIKALNEELKVLKSNADFTAAAMDHLGSSTSKAVTQLNALNVAAGQASDELLRLQAAGAGPTAQLPAAQAKFKADQAKLKFLRENLPDKKGRSTTIHQQEQAVIADRAEVASLQGDIAQATKDAAQKIKDAQEKRDAAGQAIVDSITQGRKATILQNRITSAGLTEWLGDDIKSNKAWLAFLIREKAIMLSRLKAVGASAAVIKSAMTAINALIFSTTNDIKKLGKDQAANTKARKEALLAIVNEKLDLRIQIAEAGVTDTHKNTAALLRAHRAKLEEITKELVRARKQYGKNSVEWLRLKAAQAQEVADIKALTAETKKLSEASAQMQFTFLQTQSGFAANLLGNLIPGGATGGLVGGTTGSTSGLPGSVSGPRQVPGGFEQPRGIGRGPGEDLRKATVTVAGGPTRGGQAVQNQRLLHIINLLEKIYKGTGHPEAKHRQHRNISNMDIRGD